MSQNTPNNLSDGDRNAVDALHAELPEQERAIAEGVRHVVHAEAADEAPPMPDDLLEDVLSDLGIKQTAAAPSKSESVVDRVLALFRGNSMAWGMAAAAACLVAIVAINLNDGAGSGTGNGIDGGLRNGGGGPEVQPTQVIVFQASEAWKSALASEGFESEYLRFPDTDAELQELLNDVRSIRLMVKDGFVAKYPVNSAEPEFEQELAPDLNDAVAELLLLRKESE